MKEVINRIFSKMGYISRETHEKMLEQTRKTSFRVIELDSSSNISIPQALGLKDGRTDEITELLNKDMQDRYSATAEEVSKKLNSPNEVFAMGMIMGANIAKEKFMSNPLAGLFGGF